jgi:hypothetical protein
MTKIKMVKCLLRSPGDAPAVRFIPLKEFQIWKYYMTHAHEKIVEGEEVSVWIDARSYAEQPPAQARPLESVLRIDLQYWDSQLHTVAMIQRYFPLDQYISIREVFLRHYPDVASPDGPGVIRRRFVETRGYYIQPRLPEIPAEAEDDLTP